jgi:hypothetical protein
MFEINRSTNNNDINEVNQNSCFRVHVPLSVPEAVVKDIVVGLQDLAPIALLQTQSTLMTRPRIDPLTHLRLDAVALSLELVIEPINETDQKDETD